MKEKTIAVIDGNSLMHRAFHAVQTPMNAPDGTPTNACFGFISMLLKLIADFEPDGVIAAFDAGIPEERIKVLEHYKAHRPPTDPSLKVQFPLIESLLTALNIPVYRINGYEGDDILGTLSAHAEQAGSIYTLLVTGDKDALQLATERTHIIVNRTGMSDVKVYGPAEVEERFGVTPARVPDYLGLMGDSSDNIPGVAGVGAKTATKLLQEYGDIEGVIAHASQLKGKLAEKLAQGAQLALDSREVATIIRTVPLEVDFDAVRFPTFDASAVTEAFAALGMMSQMRKFLSLAGVTPPDRKEGARLLAAFGGAAAGESALINAEPEAVCQHVLTGPEALAALAELCAGGAAAGLYAVEGAAPSCLEGAQQSMLLDDVAECLLYVATEKCMIKLEGAAALDALCRLVCAPLPLAAYNAKALLTLLAPALSSQPALLTQEQLLAARLFDVSVAAYLLDSDSGTDDPHKLLERYAPALELEKYEGDAQGALMAWAALKLYAPLRERLEAAQSLDCFERIEAPLTPVLVALERAGVRVDTDVLAAQDAQLSKRIGALTQEAYQLAGDPFNLDSPKQVGEVLFDKLGLPTGRKTQRGYSTDATVLAELSALNPLPGIILEYRELAKLRSTYLEALPRLVAIDGLIHTTFNQTVAATGRLSCSEPNLQNIPVRSEHGRNIRTAFVPSAAALGVEEAVFVAADYSQIELRLLAHLSGDEHLIQAFLSGEDFHTATAARVFGVMVADITPDLRSRAKAVNFGIVYGQQAFGLAQSLGIGFAEAGEMIKRYFEAYPQVQLYLESLKELARAQGWVATIYGRRRYIKEAHSSNANRRGFAERTAMNHPMQGTAADIIKLAMIEVATRLEAEGYRSRMVLQVHDELDFNCDVRELERLSSLVKETMEGVIDLKVPLVAEVSSGSNWALAH